MNLLYLTVTKIQLVMLLPIEYVTLFVYNSEHRGIITAIANQCLSVLLVFFIKEAFQCKTIC